MCRGGAGELDRDSGLAKRIPGKYGNMCIRFIHQRHTQQSETIYSTPLHFVGSQLCVRAKSGTLLLRKSVAVRHLNMYNTDLIMFLLLLPLSQFVVVVVHFRTRRQQQQRIVVGWMWRWWCRVFAGMFITDGLAARLAILVLVVVVV